MIDLGTAMILGYTVIAVLTVLAFLLTHRDD